MTTYIIRTSKASMKAVPEKDMKMATLTGVDGSEIVTKVACISPSGRGPSFRLMMGADGLVYEKDPAHNVTVVGSTFL